MDSLKNTFIFIVLLLPTLCYSNNYVSTVSYYTTPDGMGTPSMLFFSPSKISKFIYIYVFFSKKKILIRCLVPSLEFQLNLNGILQSLLTLSIRFSLYPRLKFKTFD